MKYFHGQEGARTESEPQAPDLGGDRAVRAAAKVGITPSGSSPDLPDHWLALVNIFCVSVLTPAMGY